MRHTPQIMAWMLGRIMVNTDFDFMLLVSLFLILFVLFVILQPLHARECFFPSEVHRPAPLAKAVVDVSEA
jgi:quinol-cytochrome oxidoreductase complex cytochrome b subunit